MLNHNISLLTSIFVGLFAISNAQAGITPTPGTVSGFEFFPPSLGGSGNGSSGEADGSRGEALTKCYRGKHAPDATYLLKPDSFYTLDSVRVYYKIFGGDGGGSTNGGGGGSSVVLLNGSPVAMGPGANGGTSASEKKGEFIVKPGDTLRLITGGGGGAGSPGTIGGGGGAGWFGGGAGGSSTAGIGGTNSAGGGGTGTYWGTSGVGNNGGVTTYPDGNSFGLGTPTNSGVNGGYYSTATNRWPAQPTRVGSHNMPTTTNNWACYSGQIGGFGGSFGIGGSKLNTSFTCGSDAGTDYTLAYFNGTTQSSARGTYYRYTEYTMANAANFQEPSSFVNTRINNGTTSTSGITSAGVGSLPGQIVLYYSSVDCSLF